MVSSERFCRVTVLIVGTEVDETVTTTVALLVSVIVTRCCIGHESPVNCRTAVKSVLVIPFETTVPIQVRYQMLDIC